MIKVEYIDGLSCPVAECDRCGGLITNVGLGAVVYLERPVEGARREIEFRHKGPCLPHDERRPWAELRTFLAQLSCNVRSDPRA